MKRLMVSMSVALVCAFVVTAAERPKRTPEQLARARQARAARLAAKGGMVTKPQSGNVLRIVSTQKTIDLSVIKSVAEDLNRGIRIGLDVSTMEPSKCAIADAEKVLKTPNTGVAVLVVEDDKLPVSLCAPENAWAILNVKTLNDDMPPKEVYDVRVRKELIRAIANAFNAGQSYNKPSVMDPVYTKVDLDALKPLVLDPEAMSKILAAAKMRGINPVRSANYRQAAMEGWAPEPTNDVQRAIWKEVHELPSNPIKIKYDPKTDK